MAELSENSKFHISLKTLGGISALIFTLVSMWFALQADIAEAKELPDVQDIKTQLNKIDERLYEMVK
jgi:hypothetical protein